MTDHHKTTLSPFTETPATTCHCRLSRREVIMRTALGASLAALSGVLATAEGTTALSGFVRASGADAAAPAMPDAPKAYIGLFKDNAIAVLDTGTNRVLNTIPIPTGPHGLVIAPDGQTVYASSDGASTVSVIDTDTDAVFASIEVGQAPHGLAITPNGQQILAAIFGTSQVAFIDTATNTVVGTVPVPQPHNIAISPDGRFAYVAAQQMGAMSLTVLDIAAKAMIGKVPLDKTPRALNFSPDGTRLYFTLAGVDAVQVLDPATNKVMTQIAVGASPHHPLVTSTGEYGLIVVQGPGQLAIFDPAKDGVVGTVAVGKMPHWVASSTDGDTAWVTNENSNDITVVDVENQTVIATIPVGNAPRKIVVQSGATAAQMTMMPPGDAMVAMPTASAPANGPTAGPADSNSVTIAGFAFSPAMLVATPGQPVTWTNKDSVAHTVTGNDGKWDSGSLAPGASFTHTFDSPGTAMYHCAIHPFMTGTVAVQN